MTLTVTGDDLQSAYFVVQRLVDGLRAGAPPVPRQVIDWCLKVRLAWETFDDEPVSAAAAQELSQELTVAQAAAEMRVTEQHVRRLARTGYIPARRPGREWLIPRDVATEWRQRG